LLNKIANLFILTPPIVILGLYGLYELLYHKKTKMQYFNVVSLLHMFFSFDIIKKGGKYEKWKYKEKQ
jgi:hypothetical protein